MAAEARGKTKLSEAHPDLAAEWHPTRNGELLPEDVAAKSSKKVWWKCATCGFEWEATVNNRVSHGTGCPACAGRVPRPGTNDLATENPEVMVDWDWEANTARGYDPTQLMSSSNIRVDWICHICGHRWSSYLATRSVHDSGCPACNDRSALEREGSLASRFPDIAAEWDSEANGDLTPDQVAPFSNQEVGWICGECGHRYKAMIRNRTDGHTGCLECYRRKRTRKRIVPLIECDVPMRIAVTYDESDGSVFDGLGRCDCLMVYDVDGGVVTEKHPVACKGLKRDGIVRLIQEQKITHFITGGLGGNAMISLRSCGAICRYNIGSDASQRVRELLAGTLEGDELEMGFERKE